MIPPDNEYETATRKMYPLFLTLITSVSTRHEKSRQKIVRTALHIEPF
ncbi:hypothetical protein BN130_589 [Cronobacter malonaticus 507]|nr:hypothetical protein BN130_589 [Cronobacter malonaticus 507]